MKRALSLLLTLCMVISMSTFAIVAESAPENLFAVVDNVDGTKTQKITVYFSENFSGSISGWGLAIVDNATGKEVVAPTGSTLGATIKYVGGSSPAVSGKTVVFTCDDDEKYSVISNGEKYVKLNVSAADGNTDGDHLEIDEWFAVNGWSADSASIMLYYTVDGNTNYVKIYEKASRTAPLFNKDCYYGNSSNVLQVVSASPISDFEYEITLNRAVNSANCTMVLGVTDSTKGYKLPEGFTTVGAKSQVSSLDKTKLIVKADNGANITKLIENWEEAYPSYSPCIYIFDPANVASGYIDSVTDEYDLPMQSTGWLNPQREIYTCLMESTYESAKLLSAELISDNSLKITFSNEVTVASNEGGFGIVALDSNGDILFDGDDANKKMRYGGTVDKTTGTEFIWTIDSGSPSVTEIIKDWQDKGYTVNFCSNSGGSQDPAGYNSRVVDGNGNPILAPVAKQHTATAKLYYALCGIDNATVSSVKIESAVAKDDFRFEIKFTAPVKVNNKGCVALMAFNENGEAIFAQDEYKGLVGGTLTEATGTDINDTWVWTINNDFGTATETIEKWIEEGYTVRLSVNGDSQMAEGIFVNNRVTDGTYSCLVSNYYNTRTKQNCATVEVSALNDSEAISIESVVYSGSSQLIVTFSEPVEISQPGFMGLRIVDQNGSYVPTISGKAESQYNMAWEYVSGSNKTQIVLTFHSKHMLSMLELEGLYEAYAGDGNHTVFCIGEKVTNERNGYIDDVIGLDGTGVLDATFAHLVAQELNMQEVTKDSREPLTIVSATAINDTDIVIKFSQPVSIDYAPFICLRVVDGNNVQVFGENGTRLQYPGTWKFADDKHDTIIWTSNNWNVKGLLSLTGPWAKFNKDGNSTRLCIEELEDKDKIEIDVIGNGFVDNIKDSRGMMLLANSIAGDMNTYDGLYVEVKEEYEEPVFYLQKAVQINDKQIALVFNKPVYFEGNPFMAIRFVNEANVLQYDGDTPLQFQGTWAYGNDEKTILVWTATYGGSVSAIMNRTGKFAAYPDYNIMFCIEEIPEDKIKGDIEDGTIHNMYTDGGTKLYSNVVGYGTNWDGVYMPITVDYAFEVPYTGDSGIAFALAGMTVAAGILIIAVRRKKISNR